MPAKDLNFSLDGEYHAPKLVRKKTPPDDRGMDEFITAPPLRLRRNRPSYTATILASANFAFLVLAGLWLFYQGPGAPDRAYAHNPDTEASLALVTSQLQTLQQQLNALQTGIGEERAAALARHEALASHLGNTASRPTDAADAAAGAASEQAELQKGWHINLGTFPNKDAARKLLAQLQALGHRAQIESNNVNKAAIHSVTVPGFQNQEAAEVAAKQLMEKTSLNGLWVGQDA